MREIVVSEETYQRLEQRRREEQSISELIDELLMQTELIYAEKKYQAIINDLRLNHQKALNDQRIKYLMLLQKQTQRQKQVSVVDQKEAVKRSHSITQGKVYEQLVPIMPYWKYEHPSDARFIGSPIDFIVFNGLHKRQPDSILMVEVKTGQGKPNSIQNAIRNIVNNKEVYWDTIEIPIASDSLT
jgi:predicted Holliday junction resolvase-like endonuclease